MKRRATKVILFLLLGAILNVAVAWACTLKRIGSAQSPRVSSDESLWLRIHNEQPATFMSGYWGTSSFGCDEFTCCLSDSEFEKRTKQKMKDDEDKSGSFIYLASSSRVHRLAAGWPIRVLESYHLHHSSDWGRLHPFETAIESRGETLVAFGDRHLPAHPLWPGFAINTIFYAGILWLLFALPFSLRRRRRIRRGLCPKCAYDLRGGNHAACPECGRVVKQ